LSDNETLFKQLVTKAQDGDGASYTELLQGLNSFLKNYLRKRIFDQNEIDEVTQEILVAVHKSVLSAQLPHKTGRSLSQQVC
jgi:DNA-directed RNA polymerase specialized sigma24 family protein